MNRVLQYQLKKEREYRKTRRKKLIGRSVVSIFLMTIMVFLVKGIMTGGFLSVKEIDTPVKDSLALVWFNDIKDSLLMKNVVFSDFSRWEEIIEKRGMVRNVDISKSFLFKLKIDWEKNPIVGYMKEDSGFIYINSGGKKVPGEWVEEETGLPSIRGLTVVNDQLLFNEQDIMLLKQLELIKRKYPELFKRIARVFMNESENMDLFTRNNKLIKIAYDTDSLQIDKFYIVFPELYEDKKIDIIDLRYDNQIVTKKI